MFLHVILTWFYWRCSDSMWQGLWNGTVSVCPSVHCLSHLSTVSAVCCGFAAGCPTDRRYRSSHHSATACCFGGFAEWAGDIDQQRQLPSHQQHGIQQQMQAVLRCQLMQEAEERLGFTCIYCYRESCDALLQSSCWSGVKHVSLPNCSSLPSQNTSELCTAVELKNATG